MFQRKFKKKCLSECQLRIVMHGCMLLLKEMLYKKPKYFVCSSGLCIGIPLP